MQGTLSSPPMQRVKLPTDIALQPPPGTYAQIYSRSGLAANHLLDVKGGTIDPDYHGNITILIHNHSNNPFPVNIGDRIAELVFHSIATPMPITVKNLDSTNRGSNGFGSTGIQLPDAPAATPSTIQRSVTPDLFPGEKNPTIRPLTPSQTTRPH